MLPMGMRPQILNSSQINPLITIPATTTRTHLTTTIITITTTAALINATIKLIQILAIIMQIKQQLIPT